MATIKKRLPYELYDVAGLEDWFSKMAAEGYHLVECKQHKAEFTVATPKENVRYRLEAVETYQYDWNKDRAYAEQGWDHVTTILGFFYIFRCDDPAIPEIHTDPTIQSWTMKKLIRKQFMLLLLIPVYGAFIQRDMIGQFFTAPNMAVTDIICVNALLLMYAMFMIFTVYFFACQAVQFNGLRKVKQRLASGLPIDRSKRYPRSFWRHGFMSVLAAVICVGVVWAIWAQQQKEGSDFPLENYPHVTLEEIFPGQTEEPSPWEEINFWTGQRLESSLLVPVQLRYGEAARLKSTGNLARVHLYYFETVSPTTARIILKGRMEELKKSLDIERSWHEKYPEDFDAIVLDTGPVLTAREGWDELWIWEVRYEDSVEPSRDYFGRIGDKVVILSTIRPDTEAVLDLMAEKMK